MVAEAREKKGFGVAKCMRCGRFVQKDPVYYSIAKKTRSPIFRERRHKTVGHLCENCFEKVEFGMV